VAGAPLLLPVGSFPPPRLPQFEGISFGIVKAGETSVRVATRVEPDRDPGGAQLLYHRPEIGHPGGAGINRHVVGDERALQERRQRIHPGLESCRRRREAALEA